MFFFPCVSHEICIHLTVGGLILNYFHLRVIFFILHKDVKSPNKGEHQKKHTGSDCVQKDSYTGRWASVRCTRPPAVLCLCKCPKMSDLDRLKRWGEKPSFSCTSHLLSGDWMISKTQGLLHRHTHTHFINRFHSSKVFFTGQHTRYGKPLYKLYDKREALMKNECTAWQTQSIETERAYQLHKYVSLHCFFLFC